jgi:hypothetical protein
VLDLALVGGRLRSLDVMGGPPLEGGDELVEDGDRLLIETGSGFGSVGEPVTRLEDGGLRYAGMTMTPFADLPDGLDRRWGTATA